MAEFDAQLDWRQQAEATLGPALTAYFAVLEDTVGSRQQAGLSRAQALFIASCKSAHRDISIHF